MHLQDYGCSLKAFRATAIKNVRLYGEMHRFIPAWLATVTTPRKIAQEAVTHHARMFGESKYKARLSHWVSQAVEGRTAGFVRESLHFAAAMAVGAVLALGIALFCRDSFPGIIGVCAALLVALTPVALYIPVENRIAILNGRTMPLLWATGVGVVASLVVLFALVTSLGIFAGVIATFVGYAATTACLVPWVGVPTAHVAGPLRRN